VAPSIIPAPANITFLLACWTSLHAHEQGIRGEIRARMTNAAPKVQPRETRVAMMTYAMGC